jgi:hypothetical protein
MTDFLVLRNLKDSMKIFYLQNLGINKLFFIHKMAMALGE